MPQTQAAGGSPPRWSTATRSRATAARTRLTLKRDLPLPHGCEGDRAELRRRLQPEARLAASFAGSGLHARDRRGRRGERGQGAVDLRDPRARPLPPADQADETTRRLHRPADDAVLLPDPAEHARRHGRSDNPAGSGPYYIAEHVANQRIVLKRNPFYRGERPANVDQMVWTTGESVEACLLAVEQDRVDFCGQPGAPRDSWRALAGKYGINRPGGQLFVAPRSRRGHSRSTTIGPPSGDRARSRSRRRSTSRSTDRRMVRPFGYLGGKRTDQMLPPALARPASIYPLGGADVVAARRWYARARVKPSEARLLHGEPSAARRGRADPRVQPQADRHRPRGEVLRISTSLAEKAATPGEPFDLVHARLGRRLCRRGVVLGAAPRPRPPSTRVSTSTTRACSGASMQRTASPVKRVGRPGPTSTST